MDSKNPVKDYTDDANHTVNTLVQLDKGDSFICIQNVYMNGVRRKLAYQKGAEYHCTEVYIDGAFRLPSLLCDAHEWYNDDTSFFNHFTKIITN